MLLTIKEVAEKLKISASFAYALVARGELASFGIGACIRVRESEVERFLDEHRRGKIKKPQSKRRHF